LTIDELLNKGAEIKMPPQVGTFKQAKRENDTSMMQTALEL